MLLKLNAMLGRKDTSLYGGIVPRYNTIPAMNACLQFRTQGLLPTLYTAKRIKGVYCKRGAYQESRLVSSFLLNQPIGAATFFEFKSLSSDM